VPELPEVETIRKKLVPYVQDRVVTEAWADPAEKFQAAQELAGAQIGELRRLGKYLIFELDDGREMVAHLGMTGAFLVVPETKQLDVSHIRARWTLDDGNQLAYRDIRRFGRLRVVPAGCYDTAPTLFSQGPDALSEAFTAEVLYYGLRRSRRLLKTQLLSQRPVAGLGNIYADEALWEARIAPTVKQLSQRRCEALYAAIKEVLDRALECGGTTLRDYRMPDESTGYFQRELKCYGRAGEPCLRCGEPLRRKVLDARSTCWCPKCQK